MLLLNALVLALALADQRREIVERGADGRLSVKELVLHPIDMSRHAVSENATTATSDAGADAPIPFITVPTDPPKLAHEPIGHFESVVDGAAPIADDSDEQNGKSLKKQSGAFQNASLSIALVLFAVLLL